MGGVYFVGAQALPVGDMVHRDDGGSLRLIVNGKTALYLLSRAGDWDPSLTYEADY